jgi:hypothetical protein
MKMKPSDILKPLANLLSVSQVIGLATLQSRNLGLGCPFVQGSLGVPFVLGSLHVKGLETLEDLP